MAIFREMTIADHEAILHLMRDESGVTVRDVDSREAIDRYLQRNPGLSFVAEEKGILIGCALCGHDGRRGYLRHVVVSPAFRKQGIAAALVVRCLDGLEALGILKTHIDVLTSNQEGFSHWKNRGWIVRDDIHRLSMNRAASPNA